MGGVTDQSDQTGTAERVAALVAFAARARRRADQMVRTAEVHRDRVVAARRFTEQAAARVGRIPATEDE
jgi:hypothetical protein